MFILICICKLIYIQYICFAPKILTQIQLTPQITILYNFNSEILTIITRQQKRVHMSYLHCQTKQKSALSQSFGKDTNSSMRQINTAKQNNKYNSKQCVKNIMHDGNQEDLSESSGKYMNNNQNFSTSDKLGFYNPQKHNDEYEYDDDEDESNTRVLCLPKIKYNFDEEDTRKSPFPKNIKKINQDSCHQIGELASQIQIQQFQKIGGNQKPISFHTIQSNKKTVNKTSKHSPLNSHPNKVHALNPASNMSPTQNRCLQIIKSSPKIPQIPYNKKVDEIMNKKPLRQRLQNLLPPQISLPISFDHQQLLKRMQSIDRTLQFLINHRGLKIIFFETIKKCLHEASNTFIQQDTLRQILYLDQNYYQIEWRINQKINRYDLKISRPKDNGSMDSRRMELRNKIVKYLLINEAQLLVTLGETKASNKNWHPKFQYKKIKIPMASLPIHPSAKNSDLRACPESQINKVQNPFLKSLFRKKKQQSQVKSLSKASVAQMIFSRVPASQISTHLLQCIKQKQQIIKQNNTYLSQTKQRMDYQVMIRIIREIFMVYSSKNVSNIFRVTLLEILNKRMNFKMQTITKCIDSIISICYQEAIGYLKQVESSKKLKVIQMDRQKYKAAEQYFLALVQKQKHET